MTTTTSPSVRLNILVLASLSILLLSSLPIASSQKRYVLVSDYDPMVSCKVNTTGKTAKDGFVGIDIEYFTELAKTLAISDDTWDFKCVNFDEIQPLLSQDPKTYWAGFGGITITYQRQKAGYQFTLPTMNTGLSVLIMNTNDPWVFLEVFSLEMGLCVLGTALAVAFIQFFLESQQYPLEDYLWNAFSSMYFVNGVRLHKTPARIIQIAYWFMVLIIISSYTANMTTVISLDKLMNQIQTADDIADKTIKTEVVYHEFLYPFGGKPVSPTSGGIPEEMVMSDLRDQVVDGFALDDPFAKIVAVKQCEIYLVARLFQPINFGLMFGSATPKSEIEWFNKGVQNLNDKVSTNRRVDKYIEAHPEKYPACAKGTMNNPNVIEFEDIVGLWIIMGIAIVISWILFLISKIKGYDQLVLYLQKKNIIYKPDPEEENRLIGDDLIVQNLRDVTYKLMGNLEKEISLRLEAMDEKVDKFYEFLSKEGDAAAGALRDGGDIGGGDKEPAKGGSAFAVSKDDGLENTPSKQLLLTETPKKESAKKGAPTSGSDSSSKRKNGDDGEGDARKRPLGDNEIELNFKNNKEQQD
eukprot:TRINITY_DN12104_c0_g1_i5.p1 TRINITY_DN12104_c0_g1~~TRINITY_DN12104_c0_g1_i5.p1  ORF type:complete len:582 (-),score=164.28 TRINITY_DN12104_c0_g1_i5:682-2427(-)